MGHPRHRRMPPPDLRHATHCRCRGHDPSVKEAIVTNTIGAQRPAPPRHRVVAPIPVKVSPLPRKARRRPKIRKPEAAAPPQVLAEGCPRHDPTTSGPSAVETAHITQEIGRWAVKEHVKKANDGIKFVKVVSGNKYPDLDLGTHYDLIIDALNRDGKDGKYETEVYKRDFGDIRLSAFKPAN
ncbi:hypothetical protein EJB05_11651, partial [Eragrostis curvula]